MKEIKIVAVENPEWDKIVTSFPNYDVYWLSQYVKGFEIHGDGVPQLLYYSSEKLRAIYVYMKRDLADIELFSSILEPKKYYDIVTPYGYGGVIFDGDLGLENLKVFYNEYINKLKEQNIISNFIRYFPIIRNSEVMKQISNVIDLGNTIALDLESKDKIWSNIISKNRNMIRKAEKNNVVIKHAKDLSLFDTFIEIYNTTMDHDQAEDYYYFNLDFYKSIHHDLYDNYEMFYAEYEGKIIAMSIILYVNGNMHYHLSGSLFEYRRLAPTNLLLYKAACWGCEQELKLFHLGGGVGSGEDNLFKFKKAFNRNSSEQFSIGKEIINEDLYKKLVDLRMEKDKSFNKESQFFPLYRESL